MCGGEPAKDKTSGSVSVYSAISPDYVRIKQADGSFKPETYAFGEGGDWGGQMNDQSIDRLKFTDIAKMIAPSLAEKNYIPAQPKDAKSTDLLIMLYWGTTDGATDNLSPEHQSARGLNLSSMPDSKAPVPTPAINPMGGSQTTSLAGSSGQQQAAAQKMFNDMALENWWSLINVSNQKRWRTDVDNATLLGYLPDLKRVGGMQGTALDHMTQDIVDDIEENRYFVVMLVYDFQLLLKTKQRKLLWETRFSIRQRGADFGKELGNMSKFASRFFGKDSGGLVRKPFSEAKVSIGEATLVGYEKDEKK